MPVKLSTLRSFVHGNSKFELVCTIKALESVTGDRGVDAGDSYDQCTPRSVSAGLVHDNGTRLDDFWPVVHVSLADCLAQLVSRIQPLRVVETLI